MKSSLRFLPLLWVALALALGASAAGQLYTCGMHPQVLKSEPGNCPICGMKLVPIKSSAAARGSSGGERKVKYYKSTMIPGEVKPGPGKDSMGMEMVPVYEGEDTSASAILIDSATIQRMNLRTALVEHGPVRRAFRTVGTVSYNEQGLRDITTKYEGWLEKLFVNTTWSVVKAGEPLFEIYSPDLYNAELNYVVALKEGEAGGPLTRAALARLQLFDVPADVIAELNQKKEPRRTFVFRAPANGVVIEKMAVVGQMMKPGERIYRVADLSSVWVQAEIYEADLPYVRVGDTVTVQTSYGSARSFEGKVDLVVPQVQEQTRTATARIVLPNPDLYLKPGMYVTVRLAATLAPDAVLVPDLAVLRSGERNTVFVALDGGYFEPREVKLGARSGGDTYEVLSGLKAGERVVTSGQFMLDSESQLREAIQKMLKPAGAAPSASTSAGAPPVPAGHEMKAMPGGQGGEHKPRFYRSTTMPGETSPLPAKDSMGRDMIPVYDQEAPAATPEESGKASGPIDMMPPSAANLFRPLALGSADAGAALAKDDLASYKRQLPALRAALAAYVAGNGDAAPGPLGALRDSLNDPADLDAARNAFAPVSNAVADLVLAAGTPGLHVFECTMVKARWVQREGGTRNPFYGARMLTCGEELELAAQPAAAARRPPPLAPAAFARALPAGHPPIAAPRKLSLQEFADSQRGIVSSDGRVGAEGEACGSCGMTTAQMAAGEPCEPDATANP